jgi:urease accessory protein
VGPGRGSGVIARTTAVVEAGGVLGELACAPPLTLRQVHGAAGRCELRLVGTAAGPLPGDDLALSLQLLPGARAALRAVAASLAQGGASSLSMRADLAEGADLVADPGALIVCAGGQVDVRLSLALAAGAAVDWREVVVLGRTGEPAGQARLRWDVTRCGRPVLRQAVDVSLAGHRVLASALISDPSGSARTVVWSATAVAQRVDQHTLLVSVLDDDAARAGRRLDELCSRARG